MKLILASASPRRAELLQQMGLEFDIKAVDIDESVDAGESPEAYVRRLALQKARAAKKFYPAVDTLLLGSDTAVIVGADILGKPTDKQHAFDMLRRLSGRSHTVLTSVAIIGSEELCIVCQSEVSFSMIDEQQLEWYWASGESTGKAGAYGIQGKAAVFIKRIEGSFSGVMGLPIYETSQLLKQQGFKL
ncbi:septum formation protein Maf [Cycloclasticus sp. 46_120_T64]|nr:septum formation protein Maf [Cycloclasticus sp. 46_120_T64]